MCGIITAVNSRHTAQDVLTAYAKQYSRGSDGFGFVSLTGTGKIHAFKRFQTFTSAQKALNKLARNTVAFHHRYPTSTPNIAESNHPIHVSHSTFKYDYYVLHNGVITNDSERRKVHDALGFVYNTRVDTVYRTVTGKTYTTDDSEYNDSEALAIDVARYIEKQADSVETTGSTAIVVLQVNKKTNTLHRLYYGRNEGNPLYVRRSHGSVLITSQNVTGKGVLVTSNTLYGLNAKGKLIDTIKCILPASRSYGYGYNYNWHDTYDTPKTEKKPEEKTDTLALPLPQDTDRIHTLESERDTLTEYIELAKDYAQQYKLSDDDMQDIEQQEQRIADIDSELTKLYDAQRT